jgi:hypothetical protein
MEAGGDPTLSAQCLLFRFFADFRRRCFGFSDERIDETIAAEMLAPF